MPDPISITSLIIEVGGVIASLMKYAKAVRDSRPDARRLSEELFALKGILEHISAQAEPLSKSEEGLCDPEFLTNALARTDETLQSLLFDLEEPVDKYKRLKQKLEWPLTREKFNAHLIRLERVKSCLILVFTSDSNALNRDLHRKLTDLATSLEENLKIRNDERISTAHRDLCRWLAPSCPTGAHLRASRARLDQTGKWFIDTIFKEWLWGHDTYRQILFLLGKWKTTLFSHVVDKLTSMSTHAQGVAFGYFYCSFGDVASQDPKNILGSLLAQLSESNPSILESIWPFYEAKMNPIAGRYPVDIADIEDAIIEHMSGDQPVVLLVDALNESCQSENIKRSLIRMLSKLPNLRVLLTGTTDMFSCEHARIININVTGITDDIDTFIRFTLQEDGMLKKLNSKLKDQIWETISQGADGSSVLQSYGVVAANLFAYRFRWVQLSLENLGSLRTVGKIREALQTLPRTLRETYAGILQRIPESDWELSRAAFLWLSFSNRSLTLDELNEAVVLEETSTVLDEDMKLVSPGILLEICQGLITQDEVGNVSLAHASVKDFLTSEWIRSSSVQYFSLDPATAGKTLMRQCLTYLCLDNFRSGYVHSIDSILEREGKHSLLEYAAHFWASHSKSRDFDGRDYQIVDRLLSSRNLLRCGNFGVWVQTIAPDIDVRIIETTHPLYYAASFGLVSVVKAIIESTPGIDLDAPGGRFGSTPLYVACWRGNHEAVEILLQAGANPYRPDSSTGLTVFFLPQTPKFARTKEILSKAPMKDISRDGPKSTCSESPRSDTSLQPRCRALSDDIEGHKVESDNKKVPLDTDIGQRTFGSSPALLPSTIPTLEEFLAQVMELNPRLEPALAQRLAQEQCRRYERLTRMRQKHSQDIINHSCRSGGGSPSSFPPGVPLPPVPSLPAQFECPICFEVKKFQKPSDWSKHAYEDVQPFTCTFPSCPDPKTFKRKADWVRHEMELHRRPEYWACSFPKCGLTFTRKDNFLGHLVREHRLTKPMVKGRKPSFPEEQLAPPESNDKTLWEIVEQCHREEPSHEERCQFCGDSLGSWKKLMVHLGKHMEELAMPVLEMVNQSVGS
ncbi:uncharacterized protein N7446_000260 [Penicillium canescens]|uniref:uncharacterized protein n=1 Tax=Penicillium canescens TaxID=5083 RepID=UPI0026DF78F3|nr:uncharacterized protein N7446_000260 [Penicillium canescens]KAJ6077324.1 hypothetical protein N7446_000260 [Penicillium canescens]